MRVPKIYPVWRSPQGAEARLGKANGPALAGPIALFDAGRRFAAERH
jgi:hypothetical protein